MQQSKRVIACVVGVVIGVVALSACDLGDTKESSPDPTSANIKMTQVKGIIGMPDGYRNVAMGCDAYGDMIFVTSRGSDLSGGPQGGGLGSGVFVIANHAACAK